MTKMFKISILIVTAGFILFLNYFTYSGNKDENPSYELDKLFNLPEELAESSGIIIYDSLIWTFNDSGGDAVIYALDPFNGKMVKSIEIADAVNKDWEDIAQNDEFILIGDFGNNEGSRKDLCIYFILKRLINKNETHQKIKANVIEFTFEDQQDYTPALYANTFDCEAMIATADSIYLFTKDWLNLKSAVYSLPLSEGNVTAKHISNINSDGLVTGADYNSENNCLVLCGYNLFYPFIIVTEIYSFSPILNIGLEELSGAQIEGIAIAGKDKYLFSNEKSAIPQAIHKIELKK